MTDESLQTALAIMKTRLNRTQANTALDETALMPRLRAAAQELAGVRGIILLDTDSDILFLVDYATWRYQNRDKPDAMPKWLRMDLRERYIHQPRGGSA